MNLLRAPKRGDLVDLDAVFDRLLSPSPKRDPMTDPYRTPLLNNARQHLLAAIEENRANRTRILEKICMKSSVSAPYSGDLEMVGHLCKVYATACEHERELLKQLEGLER